MGRIIIVGDCHGRSNWERVVEDNPVYDKMVFLGDYWDSLNLSHEVQRANFLEILEYKKKNFDRVKLLLGNHDYHYLPGVRSQGEAYSGFQAVWSFDIGSFFSSNKESFQMAFDYGPFLITHAGVSKTWLNARDYYKTNQGLEAHEVARYINGLFAKSPSFFRFTGYNIYGDNLTQSPIWIRPASLLKEAQEFPFIQIVGHTQQSGILLSNNPPLKGDCIFIDTMGTSGQYLVIEEDAVHIKQVSL